MTDQNKSIVLVDDDKFLLDMYSMKFQQAGWAVQACLSVKAALDKLRGGLTPTAVAFDLIMPEMDGFALLQTIRDEKLAVGAKLVALTNQSDEAEQNKAKELGADRYIIKASMIPSEVVAAITEEISKS
jgi:DNA-binding response OmpR family regulator